MVGEIHGVPGVAAFGRQGGKGDGVGAEGDDVVGADHALVAEAEAAGEIEARGQGAEVALSLAGGDGEALVVVGAEAGEDLVGGVEIAGLGEAKFADQAVLAGAPGALDAAFSLGRVGGDLLDAEFLESPAQLGGALFPGELFGYGPMGIVALEDAVAVAVDTEGHAVSGDHGVHRAHIAEGIFGFELKVSGEDLAGGVILKADEGELGAAAFQPVVAAGVGKHHHAEAGTAQAAGTILASPTLLRRSQLGAAQDAAHGLATDHEVLLAMKFLAEMRIVEALILAACQLEDRLAQGCGQSPGHGPSAVAVMHPSHGVGTVAPLEPLHLPFTQLQQSSGFAYAQSPGHRILNHFHALQLFLTHRHHPERVTESRCSYGVTLSWSIYSKLSRPRRFFPQPANLRGFAFSIFPMEQLCSVASPSLLLFILSDGCR